MDYKKIFIKDACPTSIGGQAIMEGVMMRGPNRMAIAMRLPSNQIYLRTRKLDPPSGIRKVPILRGVVSFFASLVTGMRTLMESADILEQYLPEDEIEKPSKLEEKISNRFGERALWNIMLTISMIVAIAISLGVFVIFPTVAVNWLKTWVSNTVALNLIEGVFRIILFLLYITLISRMNDIHTLFQYHGAEHKSIHCFENGQELTPENAIEFYRLHPRCGTSFLMFVMIISLLLFSLLGWPNVWLRIGSRILLMPVIAGLSYELLRWAGRSDNALVRILSYPGLMLQKLTTADPDEAQLEIAITSLKAVLVPADAPDVDGIVGEIEPSEPTADESKSASEGDEEESDLAESDGISEIDEGNSAGSDDSEDVSDESDETKHVFMKGYLGDGSIGSVVRWGQETLAGVENGHNEAIDIFCYVMGFTKTAIITHGREQMFVPDREEYERRIQMRLDGTPLQYITGVQEFMGLLFRVNPNVLIPRLDTEVLVEQAIGLIRAKEWEYPFILDLCTGSGAIGVTMAHEFPDAEVTLADISTEALNVAMGNAQINDVFKRCIFVHGDMFEAIPRHKRYDMILCNPPYIESDVVETLDEEVRDHEPRLALDGGEDGLDFYRILARDAQRHLAGGGFLCLEIGYNQGEAVKQLIEEDGHYINTVVLQDLNHLDRVVIAERKMRQ